MKFNSIKLSALLLFSVFMVSCASHTLNAPCDQYASFCGAKTKINQW